MAAAIVGHRGDVVDEFVLMKYENRILEVSQGIPLQLADAGHGHARRQRQTLEPSVVCLGRIFPGIIYRQLQSGPSSMTLMS